MHADDCAPNSRWCRYRGYTLLEVTIALLVLTISVTTLTAAVSSAQTTAAKTRLTESVAAAAQSRASMIASQPFTDLSVGEVTIPDSCVVPGSTEPASCVEVSGRQYPIRWLISPVGTPVTSVSIAGSVSVGERTVTVSRVVVKPS